MSLLILGIESSCDETGVALVRTPDGQGVPTLLSHALHSQIEMHRAYGGVVPELASRDHIRRVLPLTEKVLAESGEQLDNVDVIAFTRGPALPGLCWSAPVQPAPWQPRWTSLCWACTTSKAICSRLS
jgi:N6-L-threonylcarbamoyladenine synthase